MNNELNAEFKSSRQLRRHYASVRSRLFPAHRQPKPEPCRWTTPWFWELTPNETRLIQAEKIILGVVDRIGGAHEPLDIRASISEICMLPMDILTNCRIRMHTVTVPRQVGMAMTRTLTKLPLSHISKLYGTSDHTAVLHAFRKYQALVERCVNRSDTSPAVQGRM